MRHMKLLIIGGTKFLGRWLVQAALAHGHTITLFNRGKTNADLFPQVENLRGDRNTAEGLAALRGRQWDAAIDTCGYIPRVVAAAAQALRDAVGHYTFISSISVYADSKQVGIDENYPVGTVSAAVLDEVGTDVAKVGAHYGPLKALCEQETLRVFSSGGSSRGLVIRPGLIVGPHDPTDRFTYWPHRVSLGGDVLVPGGPNWVTQIIDVRDLAEWTVRMVEAQPTGIYQATGPAHKLSFGEVLINCQQASQAHANFVWADEQWLLDQQVAPWSDLPLWIPTMDAEYAGFARMNCAKAIAAGLTFRPLAQTVHDTLKWSKTRGTGPLQAGLKPEREADLLAAWKTRALHHRGAEK
jgi:2'-hydroxyisoflavone reductase